MSNNLLAGKKGIIFGALDEKSMAWRTALRAHEEGAQIVLTNAPVALRMGEINKLAEQVNKWGKFDAVIRRQPILEFFLSIAAPDDAIDRDGLRELQLHPTRARLVGNPTVTVPDAAVVDVRELMDRGVVVAGRCRFCPNACQGDVPPIR